MTRELVIAIMSLAGGAMALIAALIGLWLRITERRPPPSQEVGTGNLGHPAELLRRIAGQVVAWIISGSRTASTFLLGVAAAGLLVGGLTLPSALESEPPEVEILSPAEGAAIGREISVEGEARQTELGESLAVLVKPYPDNDFQFYHVQLTPQPMHERRWVATPVHVGKPEDPQGTPFEICAVITRDEVLPGEQRLVLPPGPSGCVRVARK
ncbi:MAG: hypothetical protein A2Y61_05490 [Chloroflexi bacterium RBG_13_60_13]|nr:MAG: hypothetical protein A2Y61_05490 [Chloroflexi bacterium RBG_13_60_13]